MHTVHIQKFSKQGKYYFPVDGNTLDMRGNGYTKKAISDWKKDWEFMFSDQNRKLLIRLV